MNIQDLLRQWAVQAQANSQDTANRSGYVPQPPPAYNPDAGFIRNIPSMLPPMPNIAQAAMAPIDFIGAAPGLSDANRFLWGNRNDLPRSEQVGQSVTPPIPGPTPPPPVPPQITTPQSGGSAVMGGQSGGGGQGGNGGANTPLWAAPNIRAPEEIKLDPGYAAAIDKSRQAIEGLQRELTPQSNFGSIGGIWGALLNAFSEGLVDYGMNSDWGDVSRGVVRRDQEDEQSRRAAAELGLRIPELDLQLAGQRQRVAEANVGQGNDYRRAQDTATYDYGRDVSIEGRRRYEGDRADSRAREGLSIQREATNRAEARASRQEDLIRLQIASGFGGPQADRALAGRAYGEGSPEYNSVLTTRVLGAVKGIASDSRGVRSLNQILENGGAGIKIKNQRDTAGMVAASQWLQAHPEWLDATAGLLGYGESPQIDTRRTRQ